MIDLLGQLSEAGELIQARLVASTVLLCVLVCLSMIDLRVQRLPDRIVLPMLWLGLGINAGFGLFTTPADAVFGAMAGYLSLRLISAAYALRSPCAFGRGDLKLAAMLGAWLGASTMPLILLVAFFGGSCLCLPLMLTGRFRLDTRIAFGPALALGGAIAVLAPSSADWPALLFVG